MRCGSLPICLVVACVLCLGAGCRDKGDAPMSAAEQKQATEFVQKRQAANKEAIKRHKSEIAPFDKDRNGNVDPDKLEAYRTVRHESRIAERQNFINTMWEQFDANGDHDLTRSEIQGVLDALVAAEAIEGPEFKRAEARIQVYLEHFDTDDDGVISSVENMMAYCFLREARRKDAKPTDELVFGAVVVRD